MTVRLRSRQALAALAASLLALAFAEPAAAHGISARADLPIPGWLFAWAAALILVASFAALVLLWTKPVLQQPRERRLFKLPVVVDVITGLVGVALFIVVVYSAFTGTQTAAANLAPTAIFVVFWVGLAVASAIFGNLFNLLNPWRAVARAVAAISNKVAPGKTPAAVAYPDWLGRWPAAIMLLLFTWVELAWTGREEPAALGALAVAYAVLQLVGMSIFGIEKWTARADGFAVFFSLLGKISPLTRRDGVLYLRPPLGGLPSMEAAAGTVALVCVMIGSTTFDGASVGPLWGSLGPWLQDRFTGLGIAETPSFETADTLGLIAAVLVVAAVYQLGILGMRSVGGGFTARQLSSSFAHTLVPIALGYAVAHYFSLLVFQGQAVGFLISDPLGDGSNLFGTSGFAIDYSAVSANVIWYTQTGVLVLGHIAALALAHDRALAIYKSPRQAMRSQYWMLVVMVALTSLGLWLLSAVGD